MANWTVISNTFTDLVGTSNEPDTVTLTISPVINGVHSGVYLRKQNFKIGGATQLDSSAGALADDYNTWTGGNVDSEVEKVIFTDRGTQGQIDNTVIATVHFNSFSPSLNTSPIYIDIDEVPANPPAEATEMPVCLETTYAYKENETVTFGDLISTSGVAVTKSTLTSGTEDPRVRHSTTLGIKHPQEKIAQVTHTADNGYYYASTEAGVQVSASSVDIPSYWSSMFEGSTEVASTYDDGKIKSVKTSVLVNPAVLGELYLILAGEVSCNSGVKIEITHELLQVQDPITDVIHEVSAPISLPYSGGVFGITINGAPESDFLINLDKSPELAAFGNYDFTEQVWSTFQPGTGESYLAAKIEANSLTTNSNGAAGTVFALNRNIYTSRSFNLTIDGLLGGAVTEVGGNAPGFNDPLLITQYGLSTLTITPITYDNTSNFGTLPDNIVATRPERYKGDTYAISVGKVARKHLAHSPYATRSLLNVKNIQNNVMEGMVVAGEDVPHNSIVLKIEDKYQNGNCLLADNRLPGAIDTLEILANKLGGQDVFFFANRPSVVPFSFKITPAQGKMLTKRTDYKVDKPIIVGLGSSSLRRTTSSGVDGTTVNLSDSLAGTSGIDMLIGLFATESTYHGSRGIVPGMEVVINSDEVYLTNDDEIIDYRQEPSNKLTVASVTSHNEIELSSPQVFSSAITLDFLPINEDVELIHMDVRKYKNDMYVEGYLNVGSIDQTGEVRVYLDSLITSTNTHN